MAEFTCSPETITMLLIGCIPIQNKKLKKMAKKKSQVKNILSDFDSNCFKYKS